jgi:hypothetical protein
MFTISFHAWRPGWIASQLSFVYHLRRSSESLFLMAQNLISITMFLGIDWTETSWRCSFFLITRSDIQSRLHFCFVCRYCADTLPWARGRPRPLDVFFFFASSSSSLQITIFYICPKQAFFFNFFSSLRVSFVLIHYYSQHWAVIRHSFLCLETVSCFSLRFYTLQDYIPSIASHEVDHSKEYKLFTSKQSVYYLP